MEKELESLQLIISNAKKSLNRPYSIETIEDKKKEIQNLESIFEEHLKTIQDDQKSEISTKFIAYKEKAYSVLDQHIEKRNNKTVLIMANLDMNELATIVKLVPIFTGKIDELHGFITNLNSVYQIVDTAKRNSFFTFISNNRLDLRVQNRIKQHSIPKTIEELISVLKQIYKPTKTSNSVLNELTKIVQKGDNVTGFATKIESLVAELNEIQIATAGEENRNVILTNNSHIAFNSFMNGLKNPQVISTIHASQVNTFSEAVSIAQKVDAHGKNGHIFVQNAQTNQYKGKNSSNNVECGKCGFKHGE